MNDELEAIDWFLRPQTWAQRMPLAFLASSHPWPPAGPLASPLWGNSANSPVGTDPVWRSSPQPDSPTVRNPQAWPASASLPFPPTMMAAASHHDVPQPQDLANARAHRNGQVEPPTADMLSRTPSIDAFRKSHAPQPLPPGGLPTSAASAPAPASAEDFRTWLSEKLSRRNIHYYAGPGFSDVIDKLAILAHLLLPGQGTAQSMEDGKRAAEEYGTGNYGKAAVDLIAGTLNAALDWTPAQKLALLIGAGARTFPWRMVKHAEQMEKAGKSPEEIWRAAGLERGADGYWRAEISDRGYRLRPKVGTLDSEGFRTAGLFEQHTHPDFQRAYPDLANVQSRLRIDPNVKERGMFSPGQVSVETSLKSTAKSQFFHEFQHLIDYIEGFARGGSPYEFFIKPGVTPQDAIERYKRLAGEVAADNVKQRLYMNDKQRALRPPSWSEERYVKIPRDQQDVRFSRDVFPHAPPPHGTRYTGGVGHGR